MLTTIVIILAGGSFTAMIAMIFLARHPVVNNDYPSSQSRSMSSILEPAVSAIARNLVVAISYVARHTSIRLLLVLHFLASFARSMLTRIERRFALLIDAVRGRSRTPSGRRRGSVSFFLEQIKDYKDEMKRRADVHS